MSFCISCGATAISYCGHGCTNALYCGQKCADMDYDTHTMECVSYVSNDLDLIESWITKRRFYQNSVAKMGDLYQKDILTWWAFQIYLNFPLFNVLLFEVKGDWSKFNNKFSDMPLKNQRLNRFANPFAPYDKYNVLFADPLYTMQDILQRRFSTAQVQKISNQTELLQAFPGLVKYFLMSNARLTWEMCYRIQKTILSMPKLSYDLKVWRGYAPLNIPNSLALDIDQMHVGQRITTWGFVSVAIDFQHSRIFVPAPQDASVLVCCMLRITIPNGSTPVFLISGDPKDPNYDQVTMGAGYFGQTEVLLPAGVILEITKKHKRPVKFIHPALAKQVKVRFADAKVRGFAKVKYYPKPK